jgi:aspartyl-tRNA(Asn)/glutamyl-tRNA(Gln) amidotransferase subunit A
LRRDVDAALAEHDALVLPTLPIPAPLLGAASVEVGGHMEPVRNLMLRQTQLFNLTGHPAISLPCGRTGGGLPCGLQLVGARGETEALLRVALACEPYLDV